MSAPPPIDAPMAVRTPRGAALVGRRVKRKRAGHIEIAGVSCPHVEIAGVVEWYDGTLDVYGRPLGFKVRYDNGLGEIVRGDTLRESDGFILVNDAAPPRPAPAARNEENDVVIERQLDAEEARLERLREAREAGEEIDLLSDDDDGDGDGDADADADAPAGRTRQEVEAALHAVRKPNGVTVASYANVKDYFTMSAKKLAIERKEFVTRLTVRDQVQMQTGMWMVYNRRLEMIDMLTQMIPLREELTSIDDAAARKRKRKRARAGGGAPRAARQSPARPAGARAGTGRAGARAGTGCTPTRCRYRVACDIADAMKMVGGWNLNSHGMPVSTSHKKFGSNLPNMTLKDMKKWRNRFVVQPRIYLEGICSEESKARIDVLDSLITLHEEMELVLTEDLTRRPIDVTG